MRTPLKLLSALAAILLFLPLTVPAEEAAPTAPTDIVYISSQGADRNDGKTEATAVKSLEAATASLPRGGTVMILDDAEIDLGDIEVTKSAHRVYLAPASSTITIRGKKGDDGKVPTLTLRADDDKAPCLELGGPLAIDDLNIRVSGKSNLWISANGNTFTAGANLSFTLAEEKYAVKLTGGRQDVSNSGTMAEGATPTLNIFGGEWGEIFGGSFAAGASATGTVTLNFFGGKIGTLLTHRTSAKQKADAVINLWCGNVGKISGGTFADDFAATLNIYNGVLAADSAIINDPFKGGEGGNVHELTGTAPTFEEVSFVTVKEKDPTPPSPENPETPSDQGTTGASEKPTTPPSVKTDETPSGGEKPTPTEETPTTSDGCASGLTPVTAGLLAITAVLPFAFKKTKRKGETK